MVKQLGAELSKNLALLERPPIFQENCSPGKAGGNLLYAKEFNLKAINQRYGSGFSPFYFFLFIFRCSFPDLCVLNGIRGTQSVKNACLNKA